MVIDRECPEGHMDIKFLILHGVFVQEIEIERMYVSNVRERFCYSFTPPPPSSAALLVYFSD